MIPTGTSSWRTRPIRVVISDDECLFRASLRQLLAVPADVIKDVYGVDVGQGFDVVGEAGSGEDTVRVVQTVRPDLLVLDLSMPRMTGLEALRELSGCRETVRTILLAGTIDRTQLLAAVHLGVRGLMLKDMSTELLFEGITRVMAGQHWFGQTLVGDLMVAIRPLLQSSREDTSGSLTPRERQVLALVVAGHPNKEIARQCAVSEETVKHHLTRMFDKTGASNRIELAVRAADLAVTERLESNRAQQFYTPQIAPESTVSPSDW